MFSENISITDPNIRKQKWRKYTIKTPRALAVHPWHNMNYTWSMSKPHEPASQRCERVTREEWDQLVPPPDTQVQSSSKDS